MEESEKGKSSARLLRSIRIPLFFVLIMWGIHLFQVITGWSLAEYGLYPRRSWGLRGVLTSPLLHADFPHLISNTFPLFTLSAIILYFYRSVAIRSLVLIYLLTGLAVWTFARPVFHIGASGVVYGLVAFVFWNGIFRRNLKSIVLALIVMVFFKGMFLGILPTEQGISWESHLFGGLVGILVSFLFKEELETDEYGQPSYDQLREEKPERFFLDRDIFEKTKEERRREQEEDDNGPSNWFSTWT
jgi:membrane associated rhomboid family serine protease